MPRSSYRRPSDRDALFAYRNLVTVKQAADQLKVSLHTREIGSRTCVTVRLPLDQLERANRTVSLQDVRAWSGGSNRGG
jgi:hypothetical protein